MMYLLALAALALLPAVLVVVLGVNGAVAFMSLCLGSVLVTYVSGDVNDILDSFAAKGTLATNQWVQLGLLAMPLLLTILFTHGSVKGGKKLINILPALATGLLFALLVVPLVPANLQRQVQHQTAWHQLDSLQTAVILGGAVFSLLFLLFTHRKKAGDEEKHGKH